MICKCRADCLLDSIMIKTQVSFLLWSTITTEKNQHSHQAVVLEVLVNMLNSSAWLFLLLASLLSLERNRLCIQLCLEQDIDYCIVRSKINYLQIYQRTKRLALEQRGKIAIRLFLPSFQNYTLAFVIYFLSFSLGLSAYHNAFYILIGW